MQALTWLYSALCDEVLSTLQHVALNARAAPPVYELPPARCDTPRHSSKDDRINFGRLNAALIQQELLGTPLLLASMHSRLIRRRRADGCCADSAKSPGSTAGCKAGSNRRGVLEQAWCCEQRSGLWQTAQPLSRDAATYLKTLPSKQALLSWCALLVRPVTLGILLLLMHSVVEAAGSR